MSDLPTLPPESRRILALARRDRNAARREIAHLSLEEQVSLVCDAPPAARREILDLVARPEALVPALPSAELCFTAKAIGLGDAAWLLAHATEEQLVACLDLDAWSPADLAPDRARVGAWVLALAEAGEEALLRAAQALDPELLVLWLGDRIEVWLKPPGADFEPPAGAKTLEGQFFVRARREGDDLEDVEAILDALFRNDYWLYFRLLQGVAWELPSETEEWALRWREGRLLDLGFPSLEESLAIYAAVPARERDALPAEDSPPLDAGGFRLPVWMPRLSASESAPHSLLRAIASLPDAERGPHLRALLALANRVAVADKLPLGDAESIPIATRKAAAVASRGLDHLAGLHGVDPREVLRRAPLVHLFRTGHALEREAGESRESGR
jgi:hypothetical protein